MPTTQYYGTGRRKTSVARVFLRPGSGKIDVNGDDYQGYFHTAAQRAAIEKPLTVVEARDNFDAKITVQGGGLSGQAGAVGHGIARALVDVDPDWRQTLKDNGLLTRDSRKKERKKYGQRGARARFQFSKR